MRKLRWLRRIVSGLTGLLLVVLSALPAVAQDSPFQLAILDRQPQEILEPESFILPASELPGIADVGEFERFVDQFFTQEMPKSHIPGAAISVVKDGELFFAKGYGYANLEEKIPVVADQTLFRVASLSKLFTATATMQLYEQGLLDLDDNVNQYLERFQLDNPFEEPVTFARMMMHTDGSTKRLIGLAAPTEEEMIPLGDYLANNMPPIVWQPGELYSYSSHTIALLGYLVEQIANHPFKKYIEDNIFEPLDMRHSTFTQPPPPELADNLAVGYQYQKRKDEYKSVPFLYLNIEPGASMSATATDMAHFAIAHLQNGRYENQRILEEDTAQLMHQTHYTPHPKLPGTGYSFRERLVNNIRTIGHLGSLRGYSSSLTLLPEQNIGIFITSNVFSGIHEKFLTQFFDHYFPITEPFPSLESLDASEIDLEQFTGNYRDVEYPRHTLAKLAAPFKAIEITKTDEGLRIKTPDLLFLKQLQSIQLEPIDSLLFKRERSNAFTAFEENEEGRIIYAYNPLFPKIGTYERVHWYEVIWVQLGLLIFCVVVFLSMCGVWLWGFIQHRRGKSTFFKQPLKGAWWLGGVLAALNLIFIIGLPLSMWLNGVWRIAYGVPVVAIIFLCIPFVTTVLTAGLLIYTIVAWAKSKWSFLQRSFHSLLTLAAVVFIGILEYWNLLGFQF